VLKALTTAAVAREAEPAWIKRVRASGPHWTKHNVRRHLRLLHARLGRWPSLHEYRELASTDHSLPPAEEVARAYGSWSAARAAVLATQRVPNLRALHRAYMAGTRPEELSKRIGVTRHTVLIAFREAGLPVRNTVEWAALRQKRTDGALKHEVVNTFRRTRSITATAGATGASFERVTRILSDSGIHVNEHRPWRESKRSGPDRLSAEDALVVLKRAGRLAREPLTAKRYTELARSRSRSSRPGWPLSPQTLMKALEARTWNEALFLAGLPTQPSSGMRRRSREGEWKALRRIAKKLGRAPMMSEYDAMRGPGLLSAQGLVKPLGRWRDVLEAAGIEEPR